MDIGNGQQQRQCKMCGAIELSLKLGALIKPPRSICQRCNKQTAQINQLFGIKFPGTSTGVGNLSASNENVKDNRQEN